MSEFLDDLKTMWKQYMPNFQQMLKKQPKVRAHIVVKGRIFEGSYHVYAEQQAREHRLKGWMKVRDGLSASAFLEFELEGPELPMNTFITELRKGNRDSSVSLVTVQWKTPGNPSFTGFQRLL